MSVVSLHPARRRARPRLALLLLTLLLIAGSLVHLGLGARWIAPQTVLQALLEYNPRNFDQRIIVELRLVRLAAALLTGAALGVAGLLLQTVIRNPLDVLAQQTVAAASMEDLRPDDCYATVCRSAPFRDLDRGTFDSVMGMMTGPTTARTSPPSAG